MSQAQRSTSNVQRSTFNVRAAELWRGLPGWRAILAGGVLMMVLLLEVRAGEAAAPVTAEQKSALDVLDGVIARFEALLAKDDDAAHQRATRVKLEEFKQRREALRQEYDQGRYDELRVDLNLEYQRLASWMAPPKTPAPAKR